MSANSTLRFDQALKHQYHMYQNYIKHKTCLNYCLTAETAEKPVSITVSLLRQLKNLSQLLYFSKQVTKYPYNEQYQKPDPMLSGCWP
jgi:hypothetical protein